MINFTTTEFGQKPTHVTSLGMQVCQIYMMHTRVDSLRLLCSIDISQPKLLEIFFQPRILPKLLLNLVTGTKTQVIN